MRTTRQYCDILFDGKEVFIIARHRDTRGWCPYGEPSTALSYSASPNEIGEAITRSLNGSRADLPHEESEIQWHKALSITPWGTWDEAIRNYNMISICSDPSTDSAEIRHPHKYRTGGHVLVEGDPVYASSLEAKEIGELAHKLIHGPQPPIIEATPSHT